MLSYDPIEEYINQEHYQMLVWAFISELRPREKRIVKARWYMGLTYREIGIYLDVSTERVRQIEQSMYRRFRFLVGYKRLEDV